MPELVLCENCGNDPDLCDCICVNCGELLRDHAEIGRRQRAADAAILVLQVPPLLDGEPLGLPRPPAPCCPTGWRPTWRRRPGRCPTR